MNWFTNFTQNNQPKNPSHGSSNGGGSASAAVQSANGLPANSQAPTSANPPQGNGQNQNQQNQNTGPANPLDQFTNIFTPPAADPNNPQAKPATPGYDGFLGQWDQKVVSERANQLDFTRGIDPSIMEAAMKGDQNAFMQVMNHTSRQAFMAAAQAGHGFADRAVKSGLDKFGGGLDDRIRDYSVRTQNVATDHPVLSHPAMQPMVNAVKMTIAQNDPKLNPQQVAEMTAQYFDSIGGVYNQSVQAQNNQQSKSQEKDWLADFGLPPLQQRGQGQ